jgi:hypothetical protein
MSLDLEEEKFADDQSDGRDSLPADDDAIFGYYKNPKGDYVARPIDPKVGVLPDESRARETRAQRRALSQARGQDALGGPGLIGGASADGGGLLGDGAQEQLHEQVPQQAPQAVQPPVAPAAAAKKKSGPARSKLIDGTTDVLDQAVHGLDKFKDVKDAGVALGTDIPNFADALGDAIPGMRDGMDNLIEQYAPEQEVMQDVASGISGVHKKFETLGIKDNPVKTAQAIKLASNLLKIRQYQRNEGKDTSGVNTHQKENLRDQLLLFQQSRREREGAKLLKDRMDPYDRSDDAATSDHNAIEAAAEGMRKQAVGRMWQRGARAALGAQSLAKANQKKGVRPLNELSMEKTAYLNDKGFVPQKPLGLFDGTSSTPAFVPKKGMLVGKDAWDLTTVADRDPSARPADPDNDDPGDQVQGDEIFRNDPKRRDITRVNALKNPKANRELADAFGRQGYVEPNAAGMRDLTDEEKAARGGEGYREETEEGRAMQKKLKPVDFMAGTGRLLEGTLNSDRMVRDGRYGAAYGAKVADFAVGTGAGMGIKAVQGGLMATAGPLAAPLISIGEVGKKAVLHAKEELGRGVQTGADMIRNQVDPKGLGKAQDNKDAWNAFYGHSRPGEAPDANVDASELDGHGGRPVSTESSESFDDLRQDLDEKAALDENDRQVSELKAAQLAGDNVTTNARLRAITPGVANQQRALAGLGDGTGGVDPSRQSGTGSEIEEWARYDDENDRGFQPDPLAAKKLLDVSQDDEGIQASGDTSGFVDTSFRQLIDEAQDGSESDGLSSISEEDSSQGTEESQAGQAPEKISARMDDVLERGYLPEKQGSADVLGRRKRTWGRFAYDNTLGLAGKLLKGVGHGLVGAVKAPLKLAAWGAKGIGWLGKQAWKGMRKVGSGIKSLFTKKAPAPAPKTEEELEAERRQKAQELKAPAVARMQEEGAQQAAAQGASAADMRRLLSSGVGANPNEKVARGAGDIDRAYELLRAKVRDARLAGAAGSGPGGGGPGGGGPGGGPDPHDGSGDGGPGAESRASDVPNIEEEEKEPAGPEQAPLTTDAWIGQEADPQVVKDLQMQGIGDSELQDPMAPIAPRAQKNMDFDVSNDDIDFDVSDDDDPGAGNVRAEPASGQGPGIFPFEDEDSIADRTAQQFKVDEVKAPYSDADDGLMGLSKNEFPLAKPSPMNQPAHRGDSGADVPSGHEEMLARLLEGLPEMDWGIDESVSAKTAVQQTSDKQPDLMTDVNAQPDKPFKPYQEGNRWYFSAKPGHFIEEEDSVPDAGMQAQPDMQGPRPSRDPRLSVVDEVDELAQNDESSAPVSVPNANTGRTGEEGYVARNQPSEAFLSGLHAAKPAVWPNSKPWRRDDPNRESPGYDVSEEEAAEYQSLMAAEGMKDVSTRHEGLDLPSAQVHVPSDTSDLPKFLTEEFTGPDGELDFFDNMAYDDEVTALGDDLARNLGQYAPNKLNKEGPEKTLERIVTGYAESPLERSRVRSKFLAREREREKGIDIASKRVQLGEASNRMENKQHLQLLSDDAMAHSGPMTIGGHEVVPEMKNPGHNPSKPSGGWWRSAATGQKLGYAGLAGANALESPGGYEVAPRKEFWQGHDVAYEKKLEAMAKAKKEGIGADALQGQLDALSVFGRRQGFGGVADEGIVRAPAAGWGNIGKKPGMFASKKAKEAYKQKTKTLDPVIDDAWEKMKGEEMPTFMKGLPYAEKKWKQKEKALREEEQLAALRDKWGMGGEKLRHI